MHRIKERAHKVTPSIVGVGSHKFRPPHSKGNALVAPRLRDQQRGGGHEVIARRVHHNKDVVRRHGGMTIHEVTRPHAQPLLHVGRIIFAVNLGIEIGQPRPIRCVPFTQRTHNEAIVQYLLHA